MAWTNPTTRSEGDLITDEIWNADVVDNLDYLKAVQDGHEADTANPHGVTAAQAGADPAGSAAAVASDLTTHEGDSSNPHSVTYSQTGAAASSHTHDSRYYTESEVDALLSTLDAIPTNLVAYTTGGVPSGWSEYTAARGRVIVGKPSGGTAAGTVGTALSNLENRTHSHVYTTVPSHRHSAYWNTDGTDIYPISVYTNDGPGDQIWYTNYEGSSSPSTQTESHMMPYIQLLAIKKN